MALRIEARIAAGRLEPAPEARCLERLDNNAQPDQRVPLIRGPQERRPPSLLRTAPCRFAGALTDRHGPGGDVAPMVPAQFEGSAEHLTQGMVSTFESHDQHRSGCAARRRPGQESLNRVEQPAVGGAQAALCQRTNRPNSGVERLKAHRRRRPERRTGLDAQPGLADHTQDPLRPHDQPVR